MSLPSARSKASLCELPDETILKISSYLLDHPRSLISLSNTNKRLNRMLDEDFWVRYHERRFAFVPRPPSSDFPAIFSTVLNRVIDQPRQGKRAILDIACVACFECEAFDYWPIYYSLAKRLLCHVCAKSTEYQFIKKTDIKSMYKLTDKDLAPLAMEKRVNRGYIYWTPAQLYQHGPVKRVFEAKQAAKAAVQAKQKAKKEGAVSKRMDLLRKHLKKQDVAVGDLGLDTQQAIDDWAQTGRPGIKAFVESLMSQHESAKSNAAIAQASERLNSKSIRPIKRRKI